MMREIRGVDQRTPGRIRRWFQDDYFELIAWHDAKGIILRFQLCYRRDSWSERVLEWRRGLGFLHMKAGATYSGFLERDTWDLEIEPARPDASLQRRFLAASAQLPERLREFVEDKLDELLRTRRYRRAGSITPRWIDRLRERQREATRKSLLEEHP